MNEYYVELWSRCIWNTTKSRWDDGAIIATYVFVTATAKETMEVAERHASLIENSIVRNIRKI